LNNNLLLNPVRREKLHAVAAHGAGPVTKKNPYLQKIKITKNITQEHCKRNSNWGKSEIDYKKMP